MESFGLDSAHNVDNWRAMAPGCKFKSMAVTAVRCAGCVWDGW